MTASARKRDRGLKSVGGRNECGREKGKDKEGGLCQRGGGEEGLAAPRLAFQADSVNRVHYFLVISFYNSGLLS